MTWQNSPWPILLTALCFSRVSLPFWSTASSSRKYRILSPDERKYSSPTWSLSLVVNLVRGWSSRLKSSRSCLERARSALVTAESRNPGIFKYLAWYAGWNYGVIITLRVLARRDGTVEITQSEESRRVTWRPTCSIWSLVKYSGIVDRKWYGYQIEVCVNAYDRI